MMLMVGACSEGLQQRLRTYSLDDAIRETASPGTQWQDRVSPPSDMVNVDI